MEDPKGSGIWVKVFDELLIMPYSWAIMFGLASQNTGWFSRIVVQPDYYKETMTAVK